MKERFFSSKLIILAIILFSCLIIFNITSLALIPGDFGSADNGPPDGVVDFEDLMIFAMAYGSTPADPNWNPVCDIAGPGGSLAPDGVIDFEDLMIFAMNYGEGCGCTLPPAPNLSDPGSTLASPAAYNVDWFSVTGAASYKIQESISSSFSEVQEYTVTGTRRSFFHTVSTTTTYYYRVAAVNDCGQSGWSNVENMKIEGIPSGDTKWTIMVYMDGDNNLELCYWINLSWMESVGSTEEVDIVVQMDPYDDCTGTFRYYVTGVEEGTEYPLYSDDIVQTLPEQNMSDSATLTDFINWASDDYPADHYMLILCDHGAGWREEDGFFKGIIWDDTTGGGEHIDIPELAQSLENANVNIDILGLDACWMQMIEVAWELGMEMSTPPNYLIASEAIGWTPVWPYDDFLAQLTGNPDIEQSVICETIVNGYIDAISVSDSGTMSALHFNNEFLNISPDIINNFANSLLASDYKEKIFNIRSVTQNYDSQYKDLYDFAERIYNNVPDCQTEAQAVMDLINNVIVAEGHTGPGMDNSHGLSIYLIDSPSEYDSNYDLLQFVIDTQWDEFLKTGPNFITGINAYAVTYQGTSMEMSQAKMDKLVEEKLILDSYQLNELPPLTKGVTEHAINVCWYFYPDATGYKVYRSVNGGSFSLVFQDEPTTSYDWYNYWDEDVSEGNSYTYYVRAYGFGWDTDPGLEVTINTWLPPCSLVNPPDGSIVTEATPTFNWNPAGVSTFPYNGTIYSGETYLSVYDANTYDTFWMIWFEDMATSAATYDQDGYATPLVSDSTYEWFACSHGYDESGNLIAVSRSEDWYFGYGEPVVFNVNAYTITYQSSMSKLADTITELEEGKLSPTYYLNEPQEPAKGVTGYEICVNWHSYYGAAGYRVYRSVDGGSYSIVLDEPASGYTWYGFWDNEVSPGNTYSYYVTAYGDFGETNPSQTVTRDTFLPPCSLVSPPDGSIVTEATPTFNWNPAGVSTFPYNGTIYSGETYLSVYDANTYDTFWMIWFEDMATSAATYDQDGYATPLVSDSTYKWFACSHGYDESGNLIAVSRSEDWDFSYGSVTPPD